MLFFFDLGVVRNAGDAEQTGDVFECSDSLLVIWKDAEQGDASVRDFDLQGVWGNGGIPGEAPPRFCGDLFIGEARACIAARGVAGSSHGGSIESGHRLENTSRCSEFCSGRRFADN